MLWRTFIFSSILFSVASLSAQTPTADAFVTTGPSGERSGNNYGGAGALGVAAVGKPQGEFQSIIKFTLSPAPSPLVSITLTLTPQTPNNTMVFNSPNTAGTFRVFWQQNDNYVEGTGSPNSPTTTGVTFTSLAGLHGGADELLGTFSFNGMLTGNAPYTLSLPPGFSNDVMTGGEVSLRLEAADANIAFLFGSRTMNAPVLTITSVPEPSSVLFAFLGASLCALASKRRLKSR